MLGHGDKIDGLPAAIELLEGLKNDPVNRGIEILVGNRVHEGMQDLVAQENPTSTACSASVLWGGTLRNKSEEAFCKASSG